MSDHDHKEETAKKEPTVALVLAGFEDDHPTLVKAAKVAGLVLVGFYAGRHWFKRRR